MIVFASSVPVIATVVALRVVVVPEWGAIRFVDNVVETSTLVKALIVKAPVQVMNPTPTVHEFIEMVVPENGLIVFDSNIPVLIATVVEFNVNVLPE